MTEFNRPAFVLTENQGSIFGSGRSVPGVDLIRTLQQIDSLFDRYGGHAMACGFTLKKTTSQAAFTEAFCKTAQTSLVAVAAANFSEKKITVAAELTLADLTWQFIEQLEWLEPFGEANPEPLFAFPNVLLADWQALGARQQHLRMLLSDAKGKTVKAIAFGMGDKVSNLAIGNQLTIIGTVGVNEWNGNREIQVCVSEMQS